VVKCKFQIFSHTHEEFTSNISPRCADVFVTQSTALFGKCNFFTDSNEN